MSKQQHTKQKFPRHNWHLTLDAYHEAGHAVVGHVIGRCIAAISIVRNKEQGYKGYCLFNMFAESVHDLDQWMPGNANPQEISISYGGTIAMQIICEERGWDYDYWRKSDVEDLAKIHLLSVKIVGEEREKQHVLQRTYQRQALDILETYWGAVNALAAVLEARGRIRGDEAHQIIQQAIDPSSSDWRMEAMVGIEEFYGLG